MSSFGFIGNIARMIGFNPDTCKIITSDTTQGALEEIDAKMESEVVGYGDDLDTTNVEPRDADTLGGTYSKEDIDEISNKLVNLEANKIGTVVEITNTDKANPFTCPCDGYIKVNVWSGCQIGVDDAISGYTLIRTTNTSSNNNHYTVFVKKGFKVIINAYSSSATAQFLPLTSE